MKQAYNFELQRNERERKKKAILLMISSEEKWHYLSVAKLSALIRTNFKTS